MLSLASERGGRLSSLLVGGTAAAGLKIPSGTTVNGSNAVVAPSPARRSPLHDRPGAGRRHHQHPVDRRRWRRRHPGHHQRRHLPDSTSLVAALQTAVNATALSSKVVVGADADGRITFSSTLPAAGRRWRHRRCRHRPGDATFTATANSGGFSITDPTSYTSTTSQTVYDSLGNPHTQSLYFVKTAQANKWDV